MIRMTKRKRNKQESKKKF